MLGLAEEIDAAIAEMVKGLHAYGYPWAEIGHRLGITRQAGIATLEIAINRPGPYAVA